MEWLPIRYETMVIPYPASEAYEKLAACVLPPEDPKLENFDSTTSVQQLFNGIVKPTSFRISKIVKQPDNFLPLIIGKIEPTSNGSILFLKYQLFFSSLFFISFWSVITLLITIILIFVYHSYLYALLAFGFGMVHYSVAMINFSKQVTQSKLLLDSIFG